MTEFKLATGKLHPIQFTDTEGRPGISRFVKIEGRVHAIHDVNGVKMPFYISTGMGGKRGVPAGRWYAHFGIGKDGWVNKFNSEESIANNYNSSLLKGAAEYLNDTFGDIRKKTTDEGRVIPEVHTMGSRMIMDMDEEHLFNQHRGKPGVSIHPDGQHIDEINRDMTPSTRIERDSGAGAANATLARVHGPGIATDWTDDERNLNNILVKYHKDNPHLEVGV